MSISFENLHVEDIIELSVCFEIILIQLRWLLNLRDPTECCCYVVIAQYHDALMFGSPFPPRA